MRYAAAVIWVALGAWNAAVAYLVCSTFMGYILEVESPVWKAVLSVPPALAAFGGTCMVLANTYDCGVAYAARKR